MRKSEKKGPNFLGPLLPITFLESLCNFRQFGPKKWWVFSSIRRVFMTHVYCICQFNHNIYKYGCWPLSLNRGTEMMSMQHKFIWNKENSLQSSTFFRTRVRSLATLVTDSLTNWLRHSCFVNLIPVNVDLCKQLAIWTQPSGRSVVLKSNMSIRFLWPCGQFF